MMKKLERKTIDTLSVKWSTFLTINQNVRGFDTQHFHLENFSKWIRSGTQHYEVNWVTT